MFEKRFYKKMSDSGGSKDLGVSEKFIAEATLSHHYCFFFETKLQNKIAFYDSKCFGD